MLVCTIFLLLFIFTNQQNIKELEFTLTEEFRFPDGFRRKVVTTNNQFFSPAIRVEQGDFVKAKFINKNLTEGFTIHWHGLALQGAPWQDGSFMGTQCSISDEFTYEFFADEQPGTYMYHAHQNGLRVEGLAGPFIIEDPPSLQQYLGYDDDFSVTIIDWYHVDVKAQVQNVLNPFRGPNPPRWKWVGNPHSILINGKGYWEPDPKKVNGDNFNQSLASFETFTVQQGKRYMFRFISGTSLSYLNVWIESHNMTIVRIDGNLIEPFEVQSLDINSGERYDVIVEMNQPKDRYCIQVETRYRSMCKGWGLLQYKGSVSPTPTVLNPVGLKNLPDNSKPFFGENWDPRLLKGLNTKLEGNMSSLYPSRTLFVASNTKLVPKDDSKYFNWAVSVNDPIQSSQPFEKPKSPLLTMLYKDRCDLIDESTLMWPNVCKGEESLQTGEIIDIVIVNYPLHTGKIDQHPWHLHGHSFYVLGYGPGNFSYEEYGHLLNFDNPVKRDTVTVYPSNDKGELVFEGEFEQVHKETPNGWVVIRFEADNPGVWNLHCHLTWHILMGMQLYIIEDIESLPEPPSEIPECGLVKLLET
eukprot:TRINITY_DN22990_c1_g1_i1.p1 TRINITY_DN22990_c1_g1~~TRINITY_DN22990_c1_g1_i1.p1  ORF type:complete len:626 (+),score=31.73 TRINITY_DN22990_c1_g1_i1:130-1878(+)